MAKGKFYHVYLMPKADTSYEQIEKKMNLALDWFKYDKNHWVIYSSATMDKLSARFKPLVEPTGRFFVCELNVSNRNGWMDKGFWAWLNKKRNN